MPEVVKTVGRYEILRVLGQGGMAVVYLARQVDLDRFVALKELGAFHAADPAFAQRFVRESRLAGSLTHANVVTVFDYFEHDGTPYIAMEHVERGSLRPYIGHMTLHQIGGVLEGLLAGLAAAEQRGIVHRDLKPENLMVSSDGRVKIADFGIAKATQATQTNVFLTATGTTVGTPPYMAPEQAMAQEVGPWTDLYSVGCVAYEIFTGHPPFHDSGAPMAVLLRHVNEPLAPASEVAGTDPEISDWIACLTAKDRAQRPPSATAAWEDFEEIVIGQLGPRWRRQARLPESPSEVPEAAPPDSPLTPAPFDGEAGAASVAFESFVWGGATPPTGPATPPPLEVTPPPADVTPPPADVTPPPVEVTPPPAEANAPAVVVAPEEIDTDSGSKGPVHSTAEESGFQTYGAPPPVRPRSEDIELSAGDVAPPLQPQPPPPVVPADAGAPAPPAALAPTVAPPTPLQPSPPPALPSRRRGRGLAITVGAGLLALVIALVVISPGGDRPKASATPSPTASATPTATAGPDQAYGTVLSGALAPLRHEARDVRADIEAAKTARGQSRAAATASVTYARAARKLRAADIAGDDRKRNSALVAALSADASAWKRLATAAGRYDSRGYAAARRGVAAAETRLEEALSALATAGYSIGSISAGGPIADMRRKPHPTPTPTATATATATVTATATATVPPTATPTEEPTIIGGGT